MLNDWGCLLSRGEKLPYSFGFPCRILSKYDISEEDVDSIIDGTQLSTETQPSSLQMQLPVLELLKVGSFFCF